MHFTYAVLHMVTSCSAVRCSMSQCVAVRCSALQYVEAPFPFPGISMSSASVQGGKERPIGCLNFIGHFPQKRPIDSGYFSARDLHLEAFCASLTCCTCMCVCVCRCVCRCVCARAPTRVLPRLLHTTFPFLGIPMSQFQAQVYVCVCVWVCVCVHVCMSACVCVRVCV